MIRLLLLLTVLSLFGCYIPVGPRLYHPVAVDIWCDHQTYDPPITESNRRHIIVHSVDPFERVEVYRSNGQLLGAIDCWTTKIHYSGVFPEGIHHELLTIIIYFRKFDDRVTVYTYVRPL